MTMEDDQHPLRSVRSGGLPPALARTLEGELVKALGRGEIEVLFQPQFSLGSNLLRQRQLLV